MRIFLFILIIFLPLFSIAQKEDNIWIMGINKLNYIQFSNDTLSAQALNKDIPFFGACAIVSDSTGNLLCYSNGINIYNKNHLVMLNGQGFQSLNQFPFGYPFNQSILLLPVPDTTGLYYYVHGTHLLTDITVVATQLSYSKIDFNSNILGKVIQKNISIENTSDTLNLGHLTVFRHINGKDWWLITSKYGTDQFREFLITKESIKYINDQAVSNMIQNGDGNTSFSPSGEWYARYIDYGPTPITAGELYLFRFDRGTGLLSDPVYKHFPAPEYFGGVAFSPNSRFLYLSKYDKILQYDLCANDILASETVVAEYDGAMDGNGVPLRFYGLQLAPDNKIYGNIPGFNSHYLHVIDQPDLPGLACNVLQHAVYLPADNFGTLPNLPHYRLREGGIDCDSVSAGVTAPDAARVPEIRVWPVPAADVLHFSASEQLEALCTLRLFDGLGHLALERRGIYLSPTATVALEALPPGVYFYTLETDDGTPVKSGRAIRTRP